MLFRVLVIVASACLWLLPAQASAVHVNCGDMVTGDVVLDGDVICDEAATEGLVVGGDDITVWLEGHSIIGPGSDVAGTDGIRDDGNSRTGVAIRGGTVTGFEDGIDLDADDSEIKGMRVESIAGSGISLRGARNYIYRNTTDSAGFVGIQSIGEDAYLWGNQVLGTPDEGIVVDGEDPRVVLNSVEGCLFDGIIVLGYSAGIVARNTVSGCDIGISPSGVGLKVQTNETTGNCTGIFVDDPAALVRWNNASGNCSTGIIVGQAGATLAKNNADNNDDIGIDAVLGTIDGGGNTAIGNGVENCLGVVC